jgi:YidC/Oxa1 family membrane protein insertase
MPILIALYNVFHQLLQTNNPDAVIGAINTIVYHPWLRITHLDATFFGFDLLTKPDAWQSKGWWLLAIPVLTAGLQWYQTRLMLPQQASSVETKTGFEGKKQVKAIAKKESSANAGGEKKDEKSQEDMAADMQKQMAIISPLMFGYFAFQFPVGLALYWNIFSLFGIMHQMRINQSHASKI